MTKTSWSELGGLLLRSAACAVVVLWFAAVGAIAPAAHADDDYVRQANAVFELSDANGTPPSVQCVGHAFVGQTPANSIEASTTITCRSQVHSMALQEFLRANDDFTPAASDTQSCRDCTFVVASASIPVGTPGTRYCGHGTGVMFSGLSESGFAIPCIVT
jgi:hypothetical protein